MNDELLVVRCQLAEREAFTELVRAWHPAVERYVGRMLGRSDDDVEVVDRETLARALAGLPAREREVLMLFYLEDLSLDTCAQICGVPVGTVKSRLSRAGGTGSALIGLLWATEPGLPTRTRAAFAAGALVIAVPRHES